MNSNVGSRRFFVAGTDTGVGKTAVSLLLMRYFIEKGNDPFYLKPLQTGVPSPRSEESDASFIYRHIARLKDRDPAESTPYCFPQAKAPFFAARNAGIPIDIRTIEDAVEEKAKTHAPLIIEGSGGLLVPVNETLLLIDLIPVLGAETILVARAGLGTINHTFLSVEAMTRRGVNPSMIIFVDSGKEKTPLDMLRENMEAVETFSGIPVGGPIERIEDFNLLSKKHLLSIEKGLATRR